MNQHGLENELKKDKHLKSPDYIRNRGRSNSRTFSREVDNSKYQGRRSKSLSGNEQKTEEKIPEVEDNFKPMWTWYYGENDSRTNKIVVPKSNSKKITKSRSSLDLTDALDPEWYFQG